MMGECSHQKVSNLIVPFHGDSNYIIREGELGMVHTIYEEYIDELVCRETSSEGSCCSYTDLFTAGDFEITNVSINLALSESPPPHAILCPPPISHCNLQNSIRAWCDATGLPPTISVHVDGNVVKLHKFPLISVSGYMKRELMDMDVVHLDKGGCWPGGIESFEVAASFCYGGRVALAPANVAAVRCAAEVLEMTEDYMRGNLTRRCDIYLRQVALRRWNHTLAVLEQCQSLRPLADSLLIVAQCAESIATMACGQAANAVEIHHLQDYKLACTSAVPSFSYCYGLDIDHNTSYSSISLHTIDVAHAASSSICFCSILEQLSDDMLAWIHDLAELPHDHFSQIIAAARRLGMKEKHIMYTVLQYAEKSIFSCFELSEDGVFAKKMGNNSVGELRGSGSSHEVDNTVERIEAVVALMVPALYSSTEEERFPLIRLLFALLKCAAACGGVANECKGKLERMIEGKLGQARIGDLELPCSVKGGCWLLQYGQEKARAGHCMGRTRRRDMKEVDSMSHIVSVFVNRRMRAEEEEEAAEEVAAVAELWDEYMAQVVAEEAALMSAHRLVQLLEVVPPSTRPTHDRLYAVIDSFLQAHANVSQQERDVVCKSLNCQKLSKECCVLAVQNERMPLRIIVQAMFMHQLLLNSSTAAGLAVLPPSAPPLLRRSASCHHSLPAEQQHGSGTERKSRQQLGSLLMNAAKRTSVDDPDIEVLRSRLLSLEEELQHLKRGLAGFPIETPAGQDRRPPATAPNPNSRWRRRFTCLGLLRHHTSTPPPPPAQAHGPASDGSIAPARCLDLHSSPPVCPNRLATRPYHSF